MATRDSDTGPFAIVPEWVMLEADGTAILVYIALAMRADRRNGEAWPTIKTLADDVGLSYSAAQRALGRLRDIEAVTWVQQADDERGQTANLYTVNRALPLERQRSTPRAPVTGAPRALAPDKEENHNQLEPEAKKRAVLGKRAGNKNAGNEKNPDGSPKSRDLREDGVMRTLDDGTEQRFVTGSGWVTIHEAKNEPHHTTPMPESLRGSTKPARRPGEE